MRGSPTPLTHPARVLVSCCLCKGLHTPHNLGASSSICAACARLLRLRVSPEAVTALHESPQRVRLHPALRKRLGNV